MTAQLDTIRYLQDFCETVYGVMVADIPVFRDDYDSIAQPYQQELTSLFDDCEARILATTTDVQVREVVRTEVLVAVQASIGAIAPSPEQFGVIEREINTLLFVLEQEEVAATDVPQA